MKYDPKTIEAAIKSRTLKQLISDAKSLRNSAIAHRTNGDQHFAIMDERIAAQIEKAIRTRRIQLKRKRNRRALAW